ncbi:uncharacterized protein OCT59_009167 [Rhizophagus irregularis]|uniref:uncharacterized protein n=1 Tax=Rhizophagus irregularis TaxID=588596 RepID=UPI0033250273|nr:hypothetical protein OCT59_009167 [Rhizophagus irregularis]
MDEIKLSDDVLEQIKDFDRYGRLTEEQKSLIDKLITDKELKERYIKYGLCNFCKQPETNIGYCRACNSQRFKQNFKNWTSGNHDVDEFIQKVQLKATKDTLIIEWIEYDNFKDVEYLAKGGFGATFKAVWKDGFIGCWRDDINRWGRAPMSEVALKCLYNSQGITADFLKEIESHILVYKNNTALDFIVRCHGITKDPKTNNFMMVMDLKHRSLRQHLNNYFISTNWYSKLWILRSIASGLKEIHNKGLIHRDFHSGNILTSHTEDPLKRPNADELFTLMEDLWDPVYRNKVDSVIYRQLEETDDINKKLSSSMVQLPLSSASNLLYTTHPQAVYTSKLLDFKNLPESKNADNDDLECSEFLLTNDLTELNINYINFKDKEN